MIQLHGVLGKPVMGWDPPSIGELIHTISPLEYSSNTHPRTSPLSTISSFHVHYKGAWFNVFSLRQPYTFGSDLPLKASIFLKLVPKRRFRSVLFPLLCGPIIGTTAYESPHSPNLASFMKFSNSETLKTPSPSMSCVEKHASPISDLGLSKTRPSSCMPVQQDNQALVLWWNRRGRMQSATSLSVND